MENSGMVLMPGGVRDMLPAEARRKRELEGRLLTLFESYGYQEVVTPTFEFYEVLEPALDRGMHEQLYRFIDDRGRIMVLRPDMTTPIARFVSTRLRDRALPMRFCYVANIFRRENHAGRQREFYQAGVELLGAAGAEADAEVISLACEALRLAGVENFQITVGHVEVLGGALTGAGLAETERDKARLALSNKDFVTWQNLIATSRISREHKEALGGLPYLHGGIEMLSRIEGLISHPGAQEGVVRLRKVWEILASYGFRDQVCIDLTLLRGLGYYTGIVFEGYTPGVGYPLCGGGRYDGLLAKFGFDCPATGFALGIERIMAALEKEELPAEQVPDYYITGSDHMEVIRRARALRETGCSVEIDVSGLPREKAIACASRRGIPHILVVE